MNNDLISREALKKCAIPCEIHNGALTDLCVPLYQIDNAPTIEPCKDCEDRKQAEYIRHGSSWHELQALRKFKEEHERPQGEWVCITKSTFPQYQPDEYKCPYCNTIVNYKTNYCHNCGAKLKVGADRNDVR